MQTLEQLFEQAKAGDRLAFDEIVERIRPKLDSFCLRRMSSDLLKIAGIDDIRQDTYLKAFQAICKIEWQSEGALCSWFFGVAQNVIYTHSKRLMRIGTVGVDDDRIDSDESSPSQLVRREERFNRLERAMQSLTSEQQQVVRLTRIEGRSVREVALLMKRSEKATYQLLWRAIQKLRKTFGDTASFRLPADANLRREDHHV